MLAYDRFENVKTPRQVVEFHYRNVCAIGVTVVVPMLNGVLIQFK